MGSTDYRARGQKEDCKTKNREVIHDMWDRTAWQQGMPRGQQSHRQPWDSKTGMSRTAKCYVRYVDKPRNANTRRDFGIRL